MNSRRAERAAPRHPRFALRFATPTILRHAEYAALRPGRIWSRPQRHRTPTHHIHIYSFDRASDPPNKFEFQLFVSTLRLACG